METLERVLAQHEFFEQLGPEYLKLIVGRASNVRFQPDSYICREGEEARSPRCWLWARASARSRGAPCSREPGRAAPP